MKWSALSERVRLLSSRRLRSPRPVPTSASAYAWDPTNSVISAFKLLGPDATSTRPRIASRPCTIRRGKRNDDGWSDGLETHWGLRGWRTGTNRGMRSQIGIRMTVDPRRGYAPIVTGKRLAARPDTLAGKTLYLVDCLFDNSDAFMLQLTDWFTTNLPSVNYQEHQAARKLGRRSGDALRSSPRRRLGDPGGRTLKFL